MATLRLYGVVGPGEAINASDVADQLDALRARGTRKLDVFLSSDGGNVGEGLAVYAQLKRWPGDVTVHVDGRALSIASVIALAGRRLVMPRGAVLMVHSPWLPPIAGGKATDLRQTADALDGWARSMRGIYAEASGRGEEEIAAVMDAETWFSAEEARAFFGPRIVIEEAEMRAAAAWAPALLDAYRNTPTAIRHAMALAKLEELQKTSGHGARHDAGPTEAPKENTMATATVTGGQANGALLKDPRGGFRHGGEWARAVVAYRAGGHNDERLLALGAAQGTFASELTGPGGGWAMPPAFASGIVESVSGDATLLGRMNPILVPSGTLFVPVAGPGAGSAEETAEGAATTPSALALEQRVLSLYKASCLLHVSEELASDSPAAFAALSRIIASELRREIERWLLRGTGLGEPVGILAAPSLISVAAEASGNGSGTLVAANLGKAAGRLLPDAAPFWVVSPSAKGAITTMQITAGGGPDLAGVPVVTSTEAPAIGTAGDATIVAPSGFLVYWQGFQGAATIFFAFDQGLESVRVHVRITQVPALRTPVVPALDTSTTLSHCVTTATRTG